MERRLTAADLAGAIVPLTGDAHQHDRLFEMIGDAPIVLLGEATHGTHEFYRLRSELTKRLIADYGFTTVCIEGDWPDAYRVNRYVRGTDEDAEASAALGGFTRFPTWMWRNADVLDFVGWLRAYNDAGADPKVGFYGLDLYSMYASIDAVIRYLDRVDPGAGRRAREHYACLAAYATHPERYAQALFSGLQPSCRESVLDELLEIQRDASRYALLDGRSPDQYFYVEQNARIVARAERYYRAMLDDEISTWNLRDAHMAETLEHLTAHLARTQGVTKTVVWAHNTHVGNAEATAMVLRRETSLGAILRRQYGNACFSAGFTTYGGTVTAASDWHAPEERKRVVPARSDTYEYRFHALGVPRFLLTLRDHRPALDGLPAQARERAIGVVYRPESELTSHYFMANILQQFDALYHIDMTRAVEPLEPSERWSAGEIPETYPTGE